MWIQFGQWKYLLTLFSLQDLEMTQSVLSHERYDLSPKFISSSIMLWTEIL